MILFKLPFVKRAKLAAAEKMLKSAVIHNQNLTQKMKDMEQIAKKHDNRNIGNGKFISYIKKILKT